MPELDRTRYVKVAVNSGRPTDLTFTYSVPPSREVQAGEVVHVPWGPRTLQGVVVEGPMDLGGYPPDQTRPLEPPVDGAPRIAPHRLELATWIRKYYRAPAWESYALMLPPGAGERPRTLLARVEAGEDDLAGLTSSQRELYRLLGDEPQALEELREGFKGRGFASAVSALLKRGLAERRYTLARPRGRARVVEVVRLTATPEAARQQIEQLPGRRSSRRARALRALLEAGGPLDFASLARTARGAPAVETLIRDGLLVREGDEVRLAVEPVDAERQARVFSYTRDEAATAALIERLLAAEDRTLRLPDVVRDLGRAARDAVSQLQAAGIVKVESELDRRDPLRNLDVVRRPPVELIGEQRHAAQRINEAIDREDGAGILLQGVTGSGKTEVYVAAIAHAVERGKRAIVLVPELALTPQTVRRFAERFPGRVGVLHSGLTLGEHFDEWHRIAEGEYDIVVGSRSAVFAPQPDLGLIVIDEAHEWTYKQLDPAPRYDARTAAARLGELTGAAVVFGSATPDAERWYAASQGDLERIDLPRRVRVVTQPDGTARAMPWHDLPEVEIVDMRDARSLFSEQLRDALGETLEREEQAILFLNRRGRAAFLVCRKGHSPQCPVCDVAMTLHDPQTPPVGGAARRPRLVCHQCNRSRGVSPTCEQCGLRLRPTRAGTQEVEREVRFHFLTARILRWDRDTARNAEQHEQNLRRFTNHEADVLVGTQMVAKGLDLPLVTLVGVVLADYSLRENDFRASERTLQLLEQVAGRAGRAERHGRVIVQTLQPEHPAILAVADHDVDGFFEAELARRGPLGYPPFRAPRTPRLCPRARRLRPRGGRPHLRRPAACAEWAAGR